MIACGISSTVRQDPSPGRPDPVTTGKLVPCPSEEQLASSERADECFAFSVEIDGRPFRFVADHGATLSMLTNSAAKALGLADQFAQATRVDTLVAHGGVKPARDSSADYVAERGDTTIEYWGDFEPLRLDSIRLGRSVQRDLLIPFEVQPGTIGPFDGLLGREVLSQFDLEVEVPRGVLRLYPRSAPRSDGDPLWLPNGLSARDCVPAVVIRHDAFPDTMKLDSEFVHGIDTIPAVRRLWNEEQLKLPIVANGRRIDAELDTGMNQTIMNWAAARLLGLDRNSPTLRPDGVGGLTALAFKAQIQPGADTMNYQVAGIILRLGRRTLPADTVIISDLSFVDFPRFLTEPLMLVGLRHLRNDLLFVSYSSRKVCIAARAPT